MKFNKLIPAVVFCWLTLSAFSGLQPPPSYHQGFARSASESAYPGLWKGLVGAWVPSLGPTGSTLRDVSGYGNRGTLNGETAPIIGGNPKEPGYVLDYDGTLDFVDFADHNSLRFPNSFTFAAWVKTSASGALNDILRKRNRNDGGVMEILIRKNTSNQANFVMEDDSDNAATVAGTTDISDGVWHFIVGVRDKPASLIRIYVDGVEENTATDTADDFEEVNSQPWRIGDTNSSVHFEWLGQIGIVLIYTRALLPNEISFLYRDSNSIFRLRPPLVARAPDVAPGVTPFRTLMGTGTKIIEKRDYDDYEFEGKDYPCENIFCF